MKFIDLRMVRMLSSQEIYSDAEELLRSTRANIIKAANETVEATLEQGGKAYHIVLQKNEERNFDTSCTCNESGHRIMYP